MNANEFIKYFSRRIEGDDIVDRPAEWGRSAIYFETSEEGFVGRQIQLFESGIVLAYDNNHYHDEYGWLCGMDIHPEPPNTVLITRKEFNEAWMRHTDAKNWARINIWSVWRQDDSGNRFLIEEKLTEEKARQMVSEFEARGHKQTYWCTSESR